MLRSEFETAYRAYGYRRIRRVLQTHGHQISGKTVLRLMREEQCHCVVRRKKYRSFRGDVGRIAPNLFARDFTATAPTQKWVTDVTEFLIGEKKVYLSPLIDLFNGEVIKYTVATSPAMALVITMAETALEALPPGGPRPTIHSDQGWQYQHLSYRKLLAKHGAVQSMSRKGNCLDNAAAESFFGHFKEEFLRPRHFATIAQFEHELTAYMTWFNHHRIRERLGGMSPVDYRRLSVAAEMGAAVTV